ncbi:hypothetical protein IJK16_00055, partial [Candidatus Saccharibacteria bacterium]|nr:hypothetical protein [Candidatus Saccharibacteria bacterium]
MQGHKKWAKALFYAVVGLFVFTGVSRFLFSTPAFAETSGSLCATLNDDGTIKSLSTDNSTASRTLAYANILTFGRDGDEVWLKNDNAAKVVNNNGTKKITYVKGTTKWTDFVATLQSSYSGAEYSVYNCDAATYDSTGCTETFAIQNLSTNGNCVSFATALSKPAVPNTPTAPADGTGDDESEEEEEGGVGTQTCFTKSKAVGWLICPIINVLSEAVKNLYNDYVRPFLEIKGSLLTDESTREAWSVFRNIANVVFVIMFLVVIISQLTGLGISNYGIKKMLPKIIIAAVLINLSYIICQLLVDISNIVGASLANFIAGLAPAMNPALQAYDGFSATGAIVPTITVGVAIVTSVLFTGFGWVISVLLALVSAVISLLALVLILIVRQAAVVMFVVISPLAMACYILPNTQDLFKKYLKISEALIIVYPICGLVIGVGSFVGAILINMSTVDEAGTVTSGIYGLAGMLASSVPFIFIPAILKSSLAGLGNLGAKISNLGNAVNKGTVGRIRSSAGYKNLQNKARAGVIGNHQTKMGAWRTSHGLGQRGTYEALMGVNAEAAAKRRRQLMADGGFEAAQIAQEKAAEKENLSNVMTQVMAATNNGERADLLDKEYDDAISRGDVTKLRAIAEIAGRRKDTAVAFTTKIKQDSTSGRLSGSMLEGVSKQIATGDNSKNFRAADALGFEFASQVNNGSFKGENGSYNYEEWTSAETLNANGEAVGGSNVDNAIKRHVTNSAELYGQQGKVLDELSRRATGDSVDYLGRLAQRAQVESTQTGVYDATKESRMNTFMDNAGISSGSGTGGTGSGSGSGGGAGSGSGGAGSGSGSGGGAGSG